MKEKFFLKGLCCPNCATKIEEKINKLEGVKEATVNFLTQRLIIVGEDDKMPTIVEESEKIIKRIEPKVVLEKA